MISFEEVVNRAFNGPVCMEKDFDLQIFSKKLSEVVRRHDIRYDFANPIPDDDSLADDVFEAAMELYSEVGTYCLSTHRRILFSEYEIKEALKAVQPHIDFGEGVDSKRFFSRKPESNIPPWCSVGGAGIQVSGEDIFLSLLKTYASIPLANSITTPSLTTVDGQRIVSGTPLELYGAIRTIVRAKDAMKDAGRPGLPIVNGIASATSDVATIAGSQFGLRTSDAFEIGSAAELKVDSGILNRVAYAKAVGGKILAGVGPLLGGYCGGPEGTAVTATAYLFHCMLVKRADVFHPYPVHLRYVCNSMRSLLWVVSLASQAVSRNSVMPILNLGYMSSGPTEKMCFYETAAWVIASVVSGASIEAIGMARSHLDYLSSMEPRLATEVAMSLTGKKRADANDMIKDLLLRYEDKIENAPLGKKYQECFDLKSATPSEEYAKLYKVAEKEMEDSGIIDAHAIPKQRF